MKNVAKFSPIYGKGEKAELEIHELVLKGCIGIAGHGVQREDSRRGRSIGGEGRFSLGEGGRLIYGRRARLICFEGIKEIKDWPRLKA